MSFHNKDVIPRRPRVILKPLPTARLWETRKFLDLVREFIKMSGLFCLFSFSANRLKSRWRSPAYYQSPWGATSDQGGNTREWLGFGVWPTMLKTVSRSCGAVRTRSMVCWAQLGTWKLWWCDVLTSDATTSVTYWMPILSLIMLSLKKRKYEELEQIREMRKC